MIRTIKLYGALKETLGVETLALDVNTPVELFCGLRSQIKGFRQAAMEYPNLYLILTDKHHENASCLTNETFIFPFDDKAEVIHITNEIEGSIDAAIAWVATTFLVTTATATIIVSMAVSFAISAISAILAPSPKTGPGEEAAEEKRMLIYNGAVNVMEQGYPVPLVYGHHIVGSIVVSAGVDVAEMPYDVEEEKLPEGEPPPSYPPVTSWQP
jgi:predicted phage tail protein